MKTCRSPRNQEILWRALGGAPEAKPATAQAQCCFNCVDYPKAGRSRGECTLHGEIVNGRSVKPCFKAR